MARISRERMRKNMRDKTDYFCASSGCSPASGSGGTLMELIYGKEK